MLTYTSVKTKTKKTCWNRLNKLHQSNRKKKIQLIKETLKDRFND